MPTGGHEVVLRHMEMQGRAPSPQAARRDLLRALDEACWPRTSPDEIILIRAVKASGAPREIANRIVQEVHQLTDQALDGWDPGAEHAAAVRFRSRVEQKACLLRDTLTGGIQRCWFWASHRSRSASSASEAIVQILAEAPHSMPAILDRIAKTPQWAAFWATLEPQDAVHLLQSAGHATGWSGPIQAALKAEPQAPESHLAFWIPEVPLPSPLPRNDPRVVLASLLTVWKQAPGCIGGSRGPEVLRRVAAHLATMPLVKVPTLSEIPPPQPAPKAQSVTADPLPPPRVRHQTGLPVARRKTRATAEFRDSSLRDASLPQGWVAPEPKPSPRPGIEPLPCPSMPKRPLLPEASPLETSIVEPGPWASSELDFSTTQGGIFFLLNALALEVYQQRIEDWEDPGAGWRLLWRLGSALGCMPDAALLHFLAQECALEEGELLGLPPLPEGLARLGAQRYGEAVWNETLFALPARVQVTRSHVDIHFRLNDARLEIRRAGLDINPGWLPWLGRVVTFHYGSGLEPELSC